MGCANGAFKKTFGLKNKKCDNQSHRSTNTMPLRSGVNKRDIATMKKISRATSTLILSTVLLASSISIPAQEKQADTQTMEMELVPKNIDVFHHRPIRFVIIIKNISNEEVVIIPNRLKLHQNIEFVTFHGDHLSLDDKQFKKQFNRFESYYSFDDIPNLIRIEPGKAFSFEYQRTV